MHNIHLLNYTDLQFLMIVNQQVQTTPNFMQVKMVETYILDSQNTLKIVSGLLNLYKILQDLFKKYNTLTFLL